MIPDRLAAKTDPLEMHQRVAQWPEILDFVAEPDGTERIRSRYKRIVNQIIDIVPNESAVQSTMIDQEAQKKEKEPY